MDTIVIENSRFRLEIGADAAAKSLRLKATGEEMLDASEDLRAFAVVQDRPFNNEIKLCFPNKETEYRANSVRREGDFLFVGFELVSYEAQVKVMEATDYVLFELVDFPLGPRGSNGLAMTYPPVATFKMLELPVRNREHFGDWLNVSWDVNGALALVAGEPYTWIENRVRNGFRILSAQARRGLKLRGAKCAIVAADGRDRFLDAMDSLETGLGLPQGVRSRRLPFLKESIIETCDISPVNVDEYIDICHRSGIRNLLIYHPAVTAHGFGYEGIADYEPNPVFENGFDSIREMLAKLKAEGIRPGLHILQTFIGFDTHYVTPSADPRLNLKAHFTLARPLGSDDDELYVFEDPCDSPTNEPSRILRFGGELIAYEGFVADPPFRFTGIKRGAKKTLVTGHPKGEIGGILDVCEFGAQSCYIDQRTDLQDEIAEKIARLWDCGFEFMYNDGSEGVNVPQGIHVGNAQFRVWKQLEKKPLFSEGAAKSHFSWHIQSGANAFDVFSPESFKKMIARWPLYEAPIMASDMTRLDFGWWRLWPPTEASVGTQPDMWEYATSKAAAWDSPGSIQSFSVSEYGKHPRLDDLLETMRRWEDVRRKGLLTDEWREALRDPDREFHLLAEGVGYELVEWHQIEVEHRLDGRIRAFLYERKGKCVVVYWHVSGSGTIALPSGEVLEASSMRECHFEKAVAEVEADFANAVVK